MHKKTINTFPPLPKARAAAAMRAADNELEAQHRAGNFGDGDPNNPAYNNGWNYATGRFASLFGYDQYEFMARQYK